MGKKGVLLMGATFSADCFKMLNREQNLKECNNSLIVVQKLSTKNPLCFETVAKQLCHNILSVN